MKTHKLPYIKWYSSDFLAGIRGLSATQIGIYVILINEMYERCEPLPLNYKRLAWQCNCTKQTLEKALDVLMEEGKIIIINGCLWNNRVEKEFKDRKKRSAAGKGNANTRWEKHNEINGSHMPKLCNGDANGMLYQKPETRNQKPEEKIYKKEFEEFYNLYPRKVSKRAASLKYETIIKEVSHEDLIKSVIAYAVSVKDKQKKYIPHPATWLNAGRWDDEIEEPEFNALDYLKQKREEEENEDI